MDTVVPARRTVLAPVSLGEEDSPATRTLDVVPAAGASAAAHAEDILPGGRSRGDGDGAEDHRRSSRRAWLTVSIIAAVLLVLGAGFSYLFRMGTAEPEAPPLVVVPAVEKMSEDEGIATLYEVDLVPIVNELFHATVEPGLVIGSDPGAGARVEPDSRVTISVSKGPANIPVPKSITGMTESSARDALEVAGLKGGEVTEATDAQMPAGRVLYSEPGPGQSVPAGSAVNLVLSNGRVVVPELAGLTLGEAEAALKDDAVRLPFQVEYAVIGTQEPGLVLDQSAPAASEVDQGTEIILTVSQKPEPTPEPAPEPDPTEPDPTPDPTEPAPSSPSASPAPSETKPAPGGGKPSDPPGKPDAP
jgi:serine/threonine-protein kinase